MSTIKDVAKLAGVSHGTVSNVLKGFRGVSLDKVKKVEAAMRELGYQPDATARSLKTSKTMHVGVVLPNITDPCFSQLFTGIERVLRDNQYTASLYITSEVPANERKILRQIQRQRMDGIIIATCQPQNAGLFENLNQAGVKIVFVEREVENKDYSFVGFNNKSTIYNVTSQLFSKGYKSVALAVGPEEYSSERQCIDGYMEALRKLGIQANTKLIEITNLDKESSFKAAFRLLQLGEVPEVVIASSTQIAEGVAKAISICEDNLIKKPLLVSLSEDSWTNIDFPNILKLPRQAMMTGEMSAEMLLSHINSSAFFEARSVLLDNLPLDIRHDHAQPAPHWQAGNKGTLKVLMLGSSASYATYSLLTDFKRREGVNVEIDMLSYQELYNAIKDDKPLGNYDVYEVDIPWLPEFVERGILSGLNEFIDENSQSIKELIPGILDAYAKYDDRFYVLPYMYGTQLLYYRKDLFEDSKYQRLFYEQYHVELKPPKNWAEFNAIAKFFTKEYNPDSPTLYGTTLGGKNSSGAVCEFLPRKWAYGGRTFDDNGKVVLSSKETVKALNNYCESFKYASPTSPEHWWEEQIEEFSQGKAAMMMLFMSHATDITDRKKSKVVGKIGYDVVPGDNPLLGGWSLGINSNSSKKNLAFKFISWACCKELAIPYTILGGSTPCVNLYKNSELLSVYPWLNKALESFSISRKRVMPRSISELVISERQYEEVLGEAVYKAIKGQLTPQDAVNAAAAKFQALLDNNSI